MVGVVNREGGYSSEQQENLEAIMPVIVQALQRKRSEKGLRESSENLQMKSKELQNQFEEIQEQNKNYIHNPWNFRKQIRSYRRVKSISVRWLMRSHNWLRSHILMGIYTGITVALVLLY